MTQQWKTVPVEPTPEMLNASLHAHDGKLYPQDFTHGPKAMNADVWAAMLAAAPEAPQPAKPAQQDAQAASQGDDFSQCKPPMRHIPGVRVDLLRKAATAAPTPPAPAVEGETK